MTDKEKVAKLPKWAQSDIEALHRQVAHLSRIVETIKGDTSPTGVKAWDGMIEIPLPARAQVDFHGFHVRYDEDAKALRVQASTSVAILPYASNHFTVKDSRG